MDGQNSPLQTGVHIGTLIKAELDRQERTVSWFARKLNCDRSNIYKIFKRSTIDTDLLLRISTVLACDFFSVYTALLADAPAPYRTSSAAHNHL